MKKLVYLCVLTLSVASFVNCAPKDKQLRPPMTKDPDVAQMEISNVNGLDYTYYLTARAAEAKQLLELALSKNLQQPEKSCINIDTNFDHGGIERSTIYAYCSYESGENQVEFKSTEKLEVISDSKTVYGVSLSSIGHDSASMKPKDKKDKSRSIEFTRTFRTLDAPMIETKKKGESVFRVTYIGELPYVQTIDQGKLKAVETGLQTFSLKGDFRRSASGEWTIENPNFELTIDAERVLRNSKRRTEKVTPKDVSLRLVLGPATQESRAVADAPKSLAIVGECDRLSGALSIKKYDHRTTEKGFTGALEITQNQIVVRKSGATLDLPACNKSAEGYVIETPLDVIYLK